MWCIGICILTGGIGSSGDNEGFSKDYDLPNEDAYCETCASVGMVLWNQRMCQLTGDANILMCWKEVCTMVRWMD